MSKTRTVISLFSGIEGFGLALEREGCKIIAQVEQDKFCLRVLERHWPNVPKFHDVKKFGASPLGCPVKMSASPGNARALKASVLASFTSLRAACVNFDPVGLSSKMFPDFSLATKGETLRKSSGFSWCSAGMGFRGACSTAAISAWPNAAKECFLSDVLEPHVPLRFFLSPRTAAGILRRAEKRGRILPSRLQQALTTLAQAGGFPTISTSLTHFEKSLEELGRDSPDPTIPPCTAGSPMAQGTFFAQNDQAPSEREILKAQTKTSNSPRLSPQSTTLTTSTDATKPPTACLSVRRLTPTECEVLQGFPKGWTLPATVRLATPSRSALSSGSRAASSLTKRKKIKKGRAGKAARGLWCTRRGDSPAF